MRLFCLRVSDLRNRSPLSRTRPRVLDGHANQHYFWHLKSATRSTAHQMNRVKPSHLLAIGPLIASYLISSEIKIVFVHLLGLTVHFHIKSFRFIQLLDDGECLLILDDAHKLSVHFDFLSAEDQKLPNPVVAGLTIPKNNIGDDLMLCYDESNRRCCCARVFQASKAVSRPFQRTLPSLDRSNESVRFQFCGFATGEIHKSGPK